MHNKYKNLFYYWLPVVLYCFLIFNQSSNPVPSSIPSIPSLPHIDKLFHAIGYALLGILFFRALKSLEIFDIQMLIFLSILLSTLYGLSDEVHQSYIPCRTADIKDFLADMIGSVIGLHLYILFTEKDILKIYKM